MRKGPTALAIIAVLLAMLPVLAHVNVSGTISTDTTWGRTSPAADGIYRVTGSVAVRNGATLTLEPGVIVKFNSNMTLTIGGGSGGTLMATGTAAEKIFFTSVLHDLRADTNGDGSATTPAAGKWRRIVFDVDGGGTIADAEILYGGQTYNTSLYCNGGAPSALTRVAIRHGLGVGLRCTSSACTASISESTFADNSTWPITLYPSQVSAIASNNDFSDNGNNGIYVYGATLSATSHLWNKLTVPYCLRGSVNIPTDARLDLSAGVVVKVAASQGLTINGGEFNTFGSESERVVITSFKDDSSLGDSNADGTASTPASGDWRRLRYSSNGTGALDYVDIRYGGGTYDVSVHADGGSPSRISHATIAHGKGVGLRCTNGARPDTVTATSFIENGTWPIYLYPSDASVIAADNTFTGNGNNGVRLYGQTMTGTSHTWQALPVAWSLVSTLTIPSNVTLNLSAGLVLKIGNGQSVNVSGGTLNTLGTSENKVVFTSASDDTILGDTNGDGSATTPAPGDWRRIYYTSNGGGDLTGAEFLYGGKTYSNMIDCASGCFTSMSESTVHLSSGDGIDISWSSATPTITGSVIRDNQVGIRLSSGASPLIGGTSGNGNDIFANTNYGVRNDGSNCVNARFNYWGANNGPNDPSATLDTCALADHLGSGDTVTDNVDYTGYVGSSTMPPESPTPLSPASPSEVATITPTLTVENSPSTGSLEYHFQIAANDVFTADLQEEFVAEGIDTTSWTVPTGLDENKTYYWRCRAEDTDSGIPSSWTETWRLFVNAVDDPPQAPVPTDPSNNSRVETNTPTLTVHNTSDPDDNETMDYPLTYEFEIYSDAELTTLVESQDLIAEGEVDTSYTVLTQLDENTNYWWHARAHDGVQSGSYSTTRKFFVNVTNDAGPDAPTLSSPAEGADVDSITPRLTVNSPEDVDRDPLVYSFEVYTESGLTGLVASTSSVHDSCCTGTTAWVVDPPLERSRWHWWISSARDDDFSGPDMDTASFFTPGFPMPEPDEYGYLPTLTGDTARGDKVAYEAEGEPGDVFIAYEVYGIPDGQSENFRILVNGTDIGDQGNATPGAWSSARSIHVSDELFKDSHDNKILFTNSLNAPTSFTTEWGVRKVRIDVPPPSPISSQAWDTVIDISWSPISGIAGYNVYRSELSGGPYTKLNSTLLTANIYRDLGLTNNINYYYIVRSVSETDVEGSDSNEVSAAATTANGVTPVTDLTLSISGNDIRLSWLDITTTGGVDFYRIYQVSRTSTPPFTRTSAPILGTPSSSPFDHSGAAIDEELYYYDVATVNNSGEEASW